MSGTAYLMYHELGVAGRPLVDDDPGYSRYVVEAESFRAHLAHMRAGNFRGLNVTEALRENGADAKDEDARRVVLTFDDGCETDLTIAAPLLGEANYNATFYVTAGHINRRGYLSAAQLRELSDLNFDIGCHSMTHRLLLPDTTDDELHTEIVEAKDKLEELTGRRVLNFSCPGGRWTKRVAATARAAGYESVTTSNVGVNTATTDRLRLSRVAVMRHTTLAELARICRGEGLWKLRARDAALDTAKKALGDAGYRKFRSRMLGGK
jgi:peptidoglycan/xylan/chitin deacetylase (PgdA/CDA1 family)